MGERGGVRVCFVLVDPSSISAVCAISPILAMSSDRGCCWWLVVCCTARLPQQIPSLDLEVMSADPSLAQIDNDRRMGPHTHTHHDHPRTRLLALVPDLVRFGNPNLPGQSQAFERAAGIGQPAPRQCRGAGAGCPIRGPEHCLPSSQPAQPSPAQLAVCHVVGRAAMGEAQFALSPPPLRCPSQPPCRPPSSLPHRTGSALPPEPPVRLGTPNKKSNLGIPIDARPLWQRHKAFERSEHP